MTTITDTCTAGALVRRHLRVQLDLSGAAWKEYRGLVESTFVVTGTSDQWRAINRWIDYVNA